MSLPGPLRLLARVALRAAPVALACGAFVGCGTSAPGARAQQTHSGPLALSPDGSRLYVVHPDADSVSVLDPHARSIVREVPLGSSPPSVDPTSQRYEPSVSPRALALDSTGAHLFVTGQRSGHVYSVDPTTGAIVHDVAVCSEPVGVVVSADDASVFVACSQEDSIVELSSSTLQLITTVATARKPWSLSWSADGKTLYSTHLLGPGVSAYSLHPFSSTTTWPMLDGPAGSDPTVPHGPVRGIYDAVARPGTSELWVAHIMLGIDTPQPALDFQSTVFPALSILDAAGNALARLSVSVSLGDGGAFGDVVSGPRALAFSPDGAYALVVDTDSEDVLLVDAVNRVEAGLVRPLPGHLPEGIVWGPDGVVYVQERNTEDIVTFQFAASDAGASLVANGGAWKSLSVDPMPATLRLGQKLFYSANSDDVPTTQDHWVSCSSCHLEGRSDAVTWKFAQGPRDTPSNAGGVLDTGFLFRTAARREVQDYWKTINVEQGGHFSLADSTQKPLLDAIASYVNYALPIPVPPTTDPKLVATGRQVFLSTGCGTCHSGPALTDSASGNPTLDLAGPVLLHDVGTCVTTGVWPDVANEDEEGHPRAACAFDTPALRGLVDTAPYMHDGSAATLDEAVAVMIEALPKPAPVLSSSDRQALLEYLRSL